MLLLLLLVLHVCAAGDSGGGVFYTPTGVLVGITSKADALCRREVIANRVDTAAVRSWLALQGANVP